MVVIGANRCGVCWGIRTGKEYNIIMKRVKQSAAGGANLVVLGVCALGLLGMVICGYGHAALSQDLVVEGEATIAGTSDMVNTQIVVANATNGANEGNNSKITAQTASFYPQIPNANGKITYKVTTCNKSTTKTYELVGLKRPVNSLAGMVQTTANLKVGDLAAIGTVVAPGECFDGEIEFARATGSNEIASLILDYEWKEYTSTPFSINYMQDMTPAECAKVTPREKKRLIDRRDGKYYWVEKLQDGNCWMTQNLALDLSTSTALTPSDSDVAANWTPNMNTNDFKFSTSNKETNYYNLIGKHYSWNLGNGLILGVPRAEIPCNNFTVASGAMGAAGFAGNLSQVCSYAGVLDVSGAEWKPTWEMQVYRMTFPDTSHLGVEDRWVAVNHETKEYDAHYLFGNYYSWQTATAGTGASAAFGQRAAGSICPKGWQLPTGGTGVINVSKSFTNLYKTYGLVSSDVDHPQENDQYGVYWAPFYMVRSGLVELYYGVTERVMEWGGLWSATRINDASWEDGAYNLANVNGIIRPQGGQNQWYEGFPVRCVAR